MRRIGWVVIVLALLFWQVLFGFAAFYWPQTNLPSYAFWSFVACVIAYFVWGRASFLFIGMTINIGHYYFDRLYLGDGLGPHEQWVPYMQVITVALAGLAVYLRKTEDAET